VNYLTAWELLAQYPPSSAKSEASRLIWNATADASSERPLKYRIYDILYAFQMLETRRRGIRRDRDPSGYAEFRRGYIAALAMWIPGKDPVVDDIRKALNALANGDNEQVETILRQLEATAIARISTEQRQRGGATRAPKAIDTYIKEALGKNPKLTLKGLWEQINRDEYSDIFEEISYDKVWVKHSKDNRKSDEYTQGAIRNRFYRIRKKVFWSH